MHFLNYIIWNGSPELFSIGPITLRWYGLLFALGFLLSQQILYYMFRKEGKPEKDVDTLTIYMVVATILGARLGHVIFYQPEIIWQDPLGILLPFEFSPTFRFTGLQGLASHGGAIGILFALWLYSRKKKPQQNYLQTLDRIVILVALTGALIRFGNYFNSEILGEPSNIATAVVFANPVTSAIKGERDDKNNLVDKVIVEKSDSVTSGLQGMMTGKEGRVPLKIFIFFKPGVSEQDARAFVSYGVKNILLDAGQYVDEPAMAAIDFQTILDQENNQVMARVNTIGIARHPAQLYESISCVILFLFLYAIWNRHKLNLPEGRIFGYFMIILWSLRILYEFLKISQVPFEDDMALNMGQILSIPLVIVGIVILYRSFNNEKPKAV